MIIALQPVHGMAEAVWTVKRSVAPQAQQARCHLESASVTVNDGYQDIQATIKIDGRVVRVVTESPLDPSFADIGLQVDNNDRILMDDVEARKDVLFMATYAQIVQQFKAGRHVRVQLRFWPTWPATGTHTATFSLIGFTKAYRQMQACAEE